MTDFVKSTNFASKDSLSVGNPLKIVKGTEIDTEFNNIAVAVATKADIANPTFTGVPSAPTASVNTNTTQLANTAFVIAQIADDAPTKTGTGANGNWGINAATASAAYTADFGTAAGTEAVLRVNATGQNSAYLFSNQTAWGLYSASGGTMASYTRSTGTFYFAGTALEATNAIGYNQTWQNVTGSRASSTTYTNSTTRPITVLISGGTNSSSQGVSAFYVNGVQIFAGNTSTQTVSATFSSGSGSFIVPPGATYSATFSFSSGTIWAELR